MIVDIHHESPDYQSYRAACVRSLFNAESSDFSLSAELPIEAEPWQLGLVVGPSGSGKSSLGARIWGPECVHTTGEWPQHQPIIDVIAPDIQDGGWQTVTGALSAVGLGDVPAWLRPYRVLSTGEKFRAERGGSQLHWVGLSKTLFPLRCYPGVTHTKKALTTFDRKGLIFLAPQHGLEPRT